MITAESLLEEYCNSVASSTENKFVCNIDAKYLIQLIQRLNVLDHSVTQMSYTHDDREKCIIEVEKQNPEFYDEYGDDLYYK